MNSLVRFFLLLLILPAPALAGAEEKSVERMYYKLCGVCHGNQGDGRGRAGASLQPAPTDFTSTTTRARLKRQAMIEAVANGVDGTSMVGYSRRLSTDEIERLVDFVRVSFMGQKKTSALAGKKSGRTLYIEHCSACHGDNGNTAVWAKNGLNPAPRDFTAPEAKDELSRERMINSVTQGRPGTAMMSFSKRLSAEQIGQVVDFIRSEFIGLGEPTPVPEIINSSKTHQYPGGISANATSGQTFYMNNCFTCHGKNGDGKGPRSHFNIPRPRNFTTEETRASFDRDALFQAIKKGKQGTVMPAWRTVLSDQQIADVAEFVFTSFVQTEKKSLP